MPEGPRWIVERIRADHERGRFESGEAALDEFLARYARQNSDRDLGVTFVAVRPASARVLGYYTLTAGSVEGEALPAGLAKRLPRYPVPVSHLGRLAVDLTERGLGLGEFLLVDALRRSWSVSRELGIYAVEVIAKGEASRSFYLRYGFTALPSAPDRLFLPMKVLAKLVGG